MNLLLNVFWLLLWRLLQTPPLPTAGPSPLPTPTDTPTPTPGPIPGGILDFLAGAWPVLVLVAALLTLAALLWYNAGARLALGKLFAAAQRALLEWLHTQPVSPEECGAIAQFTVDAVYDALPGWLVWVRFVVPRLAATRALADLLIAVQAQAPALPSPAPVPPAPGP